jgi:phosphatidate phosphatase LPIN
MTYIVDQLFPPINRQDEEDFIEYTSFNYWRDPVNDLDLDVSVASPSPDPENGNSNASLHAIQSKPLPTIPEN